MTEVVTRAIVTGTGSIATRHLQNLRQLFPNAKLAVVKRAQGSELSPIIQKMTDEIFTDLEAALSTPADLGVIATPANIHIEQAHMFAEQGIPMLIEKPLALTSADCVNLATLQQKNKARILVGYCLRYHPLFIALQEMVSSGAIGRLYTLRAEVGQYLPHWRPDRDYRRSVTAQAALGGGALMELSHEIDLIRALLGLPTSVMAVATRISELEVDVDDVVEIIARHRHENCGVIASIHLDLVRRIPHRFIRIDGEFGRIELDFVTPRLTVKKVGVEPSFIAPPSGFTINDVYVAELHDILDTNPPRVGLADGMSTLRVIEAASQAAREERSIYL